MEFYLVCMIILYYQTVNYFYRDTARSGTFYMYNFLQFRHLVTASRSVGNHNGGIYIRFSHVTLIVDANNRSGFGRRQPYAPPDWRRKTTVISNYRIIIGLSVLNRCVGPAVNQSRIITHIKLGAIDISRMSAFYPPE